MQKRIYTQICLIHSSYHNDIPKDSLVVFLKKKREKVPPNSTHNGKKTTILNMYFKIFKQFWQLLAHIFSNLKNILWGRKERCAIWTISDTRKRFNKFWTVLLISTDYEEVKYKL